MGTVIASSPACARLNELFDGDLTEEHKLVYVHDVIRTKLRESATLQQQAANNSKEQLAGSPDLNKELMDAIMSAFDAHNAMSTQALNSEAVRQGIKGTRAGGIEPFGFQPGKLDVTVPHARVAMPLLHAPHSTSSCCVMLKVLELGQPPSTVGSR